MYIFTGLLIEGAQAISCFQCENCQDDENEAAIIECSPLSSTFCYIEQNLITSQITKLCGYDKNHNLNLSNSCGRQGNQVYCHCDTELCNTDDVLLSYTSTTNSTSSVTQLVEGVNTIEMTNAATNDEFYCYVCNGCESTTGVLIDCAPHTPVRACLHFQWSNGTILKICANEAVDEPLEVGCNYLLGNLFCKCLESGCNEYPSLSVASTTAISTTVATTALTTTQNTTSATTTTTTPASITTAQYTTTTKPPFNCYVCGNCGSNAGFLIDCTLYTESRTCLMMIQPTGEVVRTCGTQNLASRLRNGCHSRRGYTFCKCSENECNLYPELTGVTTTTASTTTQPPFVCHVCNDCGTELGPSQTCTSGDTCSFILQQGVVTRSCGSALIDLIIPGEEGCTTTENGQICKCSTPNCNTYTDSVNPSS